MKFLLIFIISFSQILMISPIFPPHEKRPTEYPNKNHFENSRLLAVSSIFDQSDLEGGGFVFYAFSKRFKKAFN